MTEAKPTKRYRVRNYGLFADKCAGSLGDGRYIGMPPGTTGTGSVPDKASMRDTIYYVPDGLPGDTDVKAFYIVPSLLEEWDGEPRPGMVFRYNSNGERVATTSLDLPKPAGENMVCWYCQHVFSPSETTYISSAFAGEMVLAYACPDCKHAQYGVEVQTQKES